MNIAQLLRVERLGAGLFRERAGAALQPFLAAAQAAQPGFGRAEFYDCIRGALPAALDVGLAEVIADGWRSEGHSPEGMLIRSAHTSYVDVRAGGDDTLAELEARHGRLPETPRVLSGSGDGSTHHYFADPGGVTFAKALGPGVELLHRGYAAAPPSIHARTRRPYVWDVGAHIGDTPIATVPIDATRALTPFSCWRLKR